VQGFSTVEVIGRLNPPPGQEQRFAIPVVLTQQDLELALSGKFVTRVVYLEDPDSAVPNASNPDDPTDQEWLEAAPGRDPLAMADILGRPVAIIRMGSRVPDVEGPDAAFLYGCPPFESYPSRRDSAAKRPRIAKPLLAGRAVTAKPVSRKKATGKSTP